MPNTGTFHGEFSSSDASGLTEAASRIRLYPPGSTTEITLDASEVVEITGISVTVAAAMTVTVYDGEDATADNGEVISKGSYDAKGGERVQLSIPHTCQAGTYPKVKTSTSGQVDVIIRGRIRT